MARIKQIKPWVRIEGEPEISCQVKAPGIYGEAVATLETVEDTVINLNITEYKIKIALDLGDFIKAFLDARIKYCRTFKDRDDTYVTIAETII